MMILRESISYGASDDMSDLHEMIIHNVSQMVSRETIRFQQNRVIKRAKSSESLPLGTRYDRGGASLSNKTIYQVIVYRIFVRYFQPDNVRFPFRSSVIRFLLVNMCTCSVIIRLKAQLSPMLCQRIESVWCAKTSVCMAGF